MVGEQQAWWYVLEQGVWKGAHAKRGHQGCSGSGYLNRGVIEAHQDVGQQGGNRVGGMVLVLVLVLILLLLLLILLLLLL